MLHQLGLELPEYRWYRGVMPSWDNTARRGRLAHILLGSSPDLYEQWLRKVLLQTLCRSSVDEPLVFVNAWNEWGEGTHLEPDEEHGLGWLQATRNALRDALRQYHAGRGRVLMPAGAEAHLRAPSRPGPGLRRHSDGLRRKTRAGTLADRKWFDPARWPGSPSATDPFRSHGSATRPSGTTWTASSTSSRWPARRET